MLFRNYKGDSADQSQTQDPIIFDVSVTVSPGAAELMQNTAVCRIDGVVVVQSATSGPAGGNLAIFVNGGGKPATEISFSSPANGIPTSVPFNWAFPVDAGGNASVKITAKRGPVAYSFANCSMQLAIN
jgi:hypothetical protein